MQRSPASSTSDSRKLRWWLLLAGASAALILYGSLFPFRRSTVDLGLSDLVASLAFRPTTRGDIVANLLLYMPLGLCLAFACSARGARSTALVRAVLVGTALSLAVELAQVYVAFRVSSLSDVSLNAVGTLLGAAGAIAYRALGTSLRIPVLASSRLDPAALGVVLLWLGFRLAPFVPTIDWQKYKDALRPLFVDPEVGALELLRYVAGWLVVGYAVRLLTRREHALAGVLAVVAAVLLGRLVVVGKTLSASELAALAVCVPLASVLTAVGKARAAAVLAATLMVVIVLQGIAPFEWLPQSQAFNWIPFRSSLRGSIELNYSALLEKCFWYGSLVWLLAQRGGSKAAATLGTAALVGTTEIAQMWLPGRSADITDPLLALAAGLLLAMPRERERRTLSKPRGAGPAARAAADEVV